MNESLSNFFKACQKVHNELILVAELEQTKRQSLLSYDLKKVEEVTKKQQALVMKLESAERKRLEYQKLAGFENLTSKEILPLLEKEDRAVFADIFNQLSQASGELKISNKASLDIVATELNMLKDKLPSNASQLDSTPGKRGYNSYTKSTFQGTY